MTFFRDFCLSGGFDCVQSGLSSEKHPLPGPPPGSYIHPSIAPGAAPYDPHALDGRPIVYEWQIADPRGVVSDPEHIAQLQRDSLAKWAAYRNGQSAGVAISARQKPPFEWPHIKCAVCKIFHPNRKELAPFTKLALFERHNDTHLRNSRNKPCSFSAAGCTEIFIRKDHRDRHEGLCEYNPSRQGTGRRNRVTVGRRLNDASSSVVSSSSKPPPPSAPTKRRSNTLGLILEDSSTDDHEQDCGGDVSMGEEEPVLKSTKTTLSNLLSRKSSRAPTRLGDSSSNHGSADKDKHVVSGGSRPSTLVLGDSDFDSDIIFEPSSSRRRSAEENVPLQSLDLSRSHSKTDLGSLSRPTSVLTSSSNGGIARIPPFGWTQEAHGPLDGLALGSTQPLATPPSAFDVAEESPLARARKNKSDRRQRALQPLFEAARSINATELIRVLDQAMVATNAVEQKTLILTVVKCLNLLSMLNPNLGSPAPHSAPVVAPPQPYQPGVNKRSADTPAKVNNKRRKTFANTPAQTPSFLAASGPSSSSLAQAPSSPQKFPSASALAPPPHQPPRHVIDLTLQPDVSDDEGDQSFPLPSALTLK